MHLKMTSIIQLDQCTCTSALKKPLQNVTEPTEKHSSTVQWHQYLLHMYMRCDYEQPTHKATFLLSVCFQIEGTCIGHCLLNKMSANVFHNEVHSS